MITFLPTIQGRSKAKSCWKINSKCDSHVAGSWDWGIHLIGVNVMVVHSLIKVALTWVGNRNSWGTRRFCCCCLLGWLFFSLIFLSMCVKFVCVGGKGHQKRQIFLSKEIFTYSLEQRGNLVTKIKISEESKGQNEKSQHYEVQALLGKTGFAALWLVSVWQESWTLLIHSWVCERCFNVFGAMISYYHILGS